jgi:hypothetical protein
VGLWCSGIGGGLRRREALVCAIREVGFTKLGDARREDSSLGCAWWPMLVSCRWGFWNTCVSVGERVGSFQRPGLAGGEAGVVGWNGRLPVHNLHVMILL